MPRSEKTRGVVVDGPAYDSNLAIKTVGNLMPIPRSEYGMGLPTGNRSVRERMPDSRAEYELFKPITKIPKQQREINEACSNAYFRIGLLRNVVDMMSSFGCQGIQIVHPVKSVERVHKAWAQKVGLQRTSERFLNGLFRTANVVIEREVSKLTAADIRDLQRGIAKGAMEPNAVYERQEKPGKNQIPIKYIFLNPANIEVAGGDLAAFMGQQVYRMRIPNKYLSLIRSPKTDGDKDLVARLPEFIRKPVIAGDPYITLDNDKLAVYHYMKDDWQQWALPVTFSILADLILYEKMKLADMAALEGAISHIRIWKLGSLDHKIQVGPELYERLNNMLLANVGGGSFDLIWDAAIELEETGTEVYKFLGAEKYEPILKAIFAGLGIPQSLAGGGSGGSGFTNNAISLKTLIERLQYGRDLLTDFWNKELRMMQEALGTDQPARVVFDNMSLFDEAAEKMLWFQLYDRHLVDDETMQEKFGMIPEVVGMRIKREEAQREKGKKPPKATPFHDPQADHELTKIALQQGTLAPTEAGVEKKPKKAGDKSTLDVQTEQANKDRKMQQKANDAKIENDKKMADVQAKQGDQLHQQKLAHKDQEHKAMLPIKVDMMKKKTTLQLQNQKKGVPGQGRPMNSKDSTKRKQKTMNPSTRAMDMFATQAWAKEALDILAPIAHGLYLNKVEKKNLRSLSTAQAGELENDKFQALCHVEPMSTPEQIREQVTSYYIDNVIPPLPEPIDLYQQMMDDFIARVGNVPSIDKQRDMQASAYAMWKAGGLDDGGV